MGLKSFGNQKETVMNRRKFLEGVAIVIGGCGSVLLGHDLERTATVRVEEDDELNVIEIDMDAKYAITVPSNWSHRDRVKCAERLQKWLRSDVPFGIFSPGIKLIHVGKKDES